MTLPGFWRLERFDDGLSSWIASHSPQQSIRLAVVSWVCTLYDDPYRARRQLDVGQNYWWARVPGTFHDEHQVVCGYWIFEAERTVRCDSFATLSVPL